MNPKIKNILVRYVSCHKKLYQILVKGYLSWYWTKIFVANLIGWIPLHWTRRWFYKFFFGLNLPENSIIYRGCRFDSLPSKIHIGHNSIIGGDAILDGRREIYIGNNVNIARELRIFTMEHDPSSPNFSAVGGPVIIEDWVYIGTRVIILPEIRVGEGAVVASGAVVTKNVDPWTIVGGVPARKIRSRPLVKYSLNTDKHFLQ
jgi:acetyltransferase-like isoleucine patch superfamily enzyme